METTDNPIPQTAARVSLEVDQPLLNSLCPLTGSGLAIRARTGCSVRQLLCGQLRIEPEYLADRIQIIFLNGKAVDNVDTAIVTAGATIGLSAAMPGLAGAMLRKGSRYAPMRIQLTEEGPDDTAAAKAGESDVVVKLFNMLQREIGPEFLHRGVRVAGRAFGDLIGRLSGAVRSGVNAAEVDGEHVAPNALLAADWSGRQVLLTVRVRQIDR